MIQAARASHDWVAAPAMRKTGGSPVAGDGLAAGLLCRVPGRFGDFLAPHPAQFPRQSQDDPKTKCSDEHWSTRSLPG